MTDIVERLRALAERQKQERGDAMYLGKPDPEITEAANEIQLLREAWRIQHAEKVAERAEAKLWFGKAQEWKAEIERLRAHCEAMAGALERCGSIVYRNLHRQNEKVEDVPVIADRALAAYRADYPEKK